MDDKILENNNLPKESENSIQAEQKTYTPDSIDGSTESLEIPCESETEAACITEEEGKEDISEEDTPTVDEIASEEDYGVSADPEAEKELEHEEDSDENNNSTENIAQDSEEEITVAPVEEIEIIPEEKQEKKEKRKKKVDDDEAEEDGEDDDTSFFKSHRWKRTWNRICLVLLLLAFAIPVGLLAYIIILFFA